MTGSIGRVLSICVGIAMLGLFVLAGTSHAQATVGTFFDQHVETGTVGGSECLSADLAGTFTQTVTVAGHFTDTGTGFHGVGTETLDYRIDFVNGDYVLGKAVNYFNFNATPSGQTTDTLVTVEPRTIYNADGQQIGTVFLHETSHITYRDANGNGEPDEGEITANIDRFFFTCG